MPKASTRIRPVSLKSILLDEQEVAILDPREEGDFSEKHLSPAINIPLSRLELLIEDLIPRRNTRIILTDGGDGLAERTAVQLNKLGYSNIFILDGGVPAWQAAGFEVFSGINVLSKAFGEYVEHSFKTPSISPEKLQAKLAAQEDIIILDSRTPEEYERMTIPGAINVPGGELVYRLAALSIRPETLIVVNCAGRTRSIIGTQSLVNAGILNRVMALRGGTMAWKLAGFRLEHGAKRSAPEPGSNELKLAQVAAARVAERFGVQVIDSSILSVFEAECDWHTLYLLDVRTIKEYKAGHRPGSIHAPGGQLVQNIDNYVATRHSRIVLIDDHQVRALMAASWLIQMGWSYTYVLANPFLGIQLEIGDRPIVIPGLAEIKLPFIQPSDLCQSMSTGKVTVIDFANSLNYKKGHIPGAWFAVRARLAEGLRQMPIASYFVVTGDDDALTFLAAADVGTLSGKPVKVLEGGNEGWRKAGLPLRGGPEHLSTRTDDVWPNPYNQEENIEEAMREYLRWEEGLPEQVARDGIFQFGPFS